MVLSRDGLTNIVWTTPSLTGTQKSILAVALLRADGTGDIRAALADWSRDTSLGAKVVSGTLKELDTLGILRAVQSARGIKPVYRLNLPRLMEVHTTDSSDEANRSSPSRHAKHRMQMDRAEAMTTMRAVRGRLEDVERMLEDSRLERQDPAQYMALLQERDRLAEDVLPRLTAFITLYDNQKKDA